MSSLKLGCAGKEIVLSYSQILKINYNDAIKIFEGNKLARGYIQSEPGLRMQSKEKSVGLMLKATLFREANDFSPLKKAEVEKIKKYYNINIETMDSTKRKIRVIDGNKYQVINRKLGKSKNWRPNTEKSESIGEIFSNIKGETSGNNVIKKYC